MSAHMDVATQTAAPSVTAGMMELTSLGPRMPIRIAMAMRERPERGDQSVRPVVCATTRLASQSQVMPATVTRPASNQLTSSPPESFAAAKKRPPPIRVPVPTMFMDTSSRRPPASSPPPRRLASAALSAGSAIMIPAIAPPRIMPIPTLFAVKLRKPLARASASM